jgi:transposase
MISQIKRSVDGWIVPLHGGRRTCLVTLSNGRPACTCLDFGVHRTKCRHIVAVEEFLKEGIENESSVHKTERKTYSQNWPAYNQSQQNEKQLFMRLLSDMCKDIEEPYYTFGRPHTPLGNMIFCCALKIYSLYSLRRFMTDIRMAQEMGFLSNLPCFTSIGKFFQNRSITNVLMELITKSSLPLKSVETNFAIDSSGISTMRFSPYYDFKYGKTVKYRNWIKVNIACGVKTNIVTAVKLSGENNGDITFFKGLVKNTAKNFDINEISADKAYSSRDNLNLIESLGGTAYIPFRKNTTGKTKGSGSKLWNKMFFYFLYKHDEFNQHYHKRSNVESTFHMVKTKFGDSVRSKEWTSQVNEVLLKVLCHNICVVIQEMYELGIEPNF